MKQPSVNIKNKRATFDYELIDTYTAGIVLTGTGNQIHSFGKGKPGRYVLLFCERRIMGEEYAYRRVLLRFV